MNINVGYQNDNFPNGFDKRFCEWLKDDGIYHKIKLYEDYFDCQDVLVDDFEQFYFFQSTEIIVILGLSEEYFFGQYLSNKVIKDLQNNKCIPHQLVR